MLGKLIKYEFQATQREFLPLYGLIIACAVLVKVFLMFNLQNADGMAAVPLVITMIIYCILIAAACVMTLFVTFQRFQKNLLENEGYLSFTLPVKVHSHIDCKMIVSLVWTVLSIVVAAASVIILTYDNTFPEIFKNFWQELQAWFQDSGAVSHLLVWEFIVLAVVATLAEILQIYASITVGNFSSKHKLLAGFGAFIGFTVAEQIVGSLLGNWIIGSDWLHINWEWSNSAATVMWKTAGIIGIAIVFLLAFGAAFYFLTNWLLSSKLNLE